MGEEEESTNKGRKKEISKSSPTVKGYLQVYKGWLYHINNNYKEPLIFILFTQLFFYFLFLYIFLVWFVMECGHV